MISIENNVLLWIWGGGDAFLFCFARPRLKEASEKTEIARPKREQPKTRVYIIAKISYLLADDPNEKGPSALAARKQGKPNCAELRAPQPMLDK